MSTGDNIRKIRKQKGMTLQQLANILGCSQQNISQYENGKRKPKFDTIQKIATALEVSLTDLINTAEDIAKTSASVISNTAQNIGETITAIPNATQILSKSEQTIISDYQKLNNTGKNEAQKRIHELTEIPRYTHKESNMSDKEE